MALLKKLGRFAQMALSHRRRSSGMTPTEEHDLGLDDSSSFGAGEMDGAPVELESGGGALVPMGAANALQVISVSPAFVSRAKCPPGYSFVGFGPRGALGSVAHLGHPAGTCVLTKVARALGLVRRRRGRGISARDLRAALRVTRLVKHIERQ